MASRTTTAQGSSATTAAAATAPAQAAPTTQQPSQPAQEPAADGATPQPDATAKWPDGINAKDLQVLKRAQLDPDTWSAIPPSNQKKILNNLRTVQANNDRLYRERQKAQQSQAGQQQPTAPGTARTQNAPAADNSQAPAPAQDQPTLDQGPEDLLDDDSAQAQPGLDGEHGGPQQRQQQQQPAQRTETPAFDAEQLVDPQDLQTLQQIGGKNLAETWKRGAARIAQQVASAYQQRTAQLEQQNQTLIHATEYLFGQHITREFDTAVTSLVTETPALKTAIDAEGAKGKLRSKADLLHRAAGDPANYSYADAVRDAAASLFRQNVHQSAQAQLLSGRKSSLQASADPGNGPRAGRQQLSGPDRNKAIFAQLQQGLTPDAARAAVDG